MTQHNQTYVSGLDVNATREELLATVARLRAQNKAAADAHNKAIGKLTKRLDYFVNLFGHAIEAATSGEQKGVCAICYREHVHVAHRQIAQVSQLEAALYMLIHYAEDHHVG